MNTSAFRCAPEEDAGALDIAVPEDLCPVGVVGRCCVEDDSGFDFRKNL